MIKGLLGVACIVAGLVSPVAVAEERTIEILDEGADGIMVFEPGYLQANVGDTVTFVAKSPGHNVISHVVPDGAPTWKGTVSQNVKVTLTKEGVYLYECDLHRMLGMVGVIQVGKPTNLAAAKAAAATLAPRMAQGAERLDEYLGKVK